MYVVKDDFNCYYLCRIHMGSSPFPSILGWTEESEYCLRFSSVEEAKATIDFIINVVDADLEGYLFAVRVPS